MDSEPPAARRRLFIQNFGCQMNDYDVERMREVLGARGYDAAATAEEADLIVINTCSVREKAEAKVASAAGRFRELKEQRPGVTVAIGGCVAQQ
jgi:tRNA-2-methylthio-N6-dimethylallyladenosine synthase